MDDHSRLGSKVRWSVAAIAALLLSSCAGAQRATDTRTHLTERAGLVTARGKPVVLVGTPVALGSLAPDCVVVANDMSERRLSEWRGTVVILSTVPSIDTPVCDRETHTFNERIEALGSGVVCLTVSMDLPFAQKRWCGANGIERVVTLSDYRWREVGDRFGLRVASTALLARAVTVIDATGLVVYQEIVPELTSEPDYDAALAAARSAAGH